MKERIYTDDEVKILEKNCFIKKVENRKRIEYEPIFKLWTIYMKNKYPDLTAREIFEKAGINTSILHPTLPRRRIKTWNDIYKKFGKEYFLSQSDIYITTNEFRNKILKMVEELD